MRPFDALPLIGAIVAVSITSGAGCGGGASNSFVADVRSAKVAALYEGLPHQMFEAEALQHELASKPTVQLHGYPFYKETLTLGEADERALREIVCDNESFSAFSGEKKCGGFIRITALSGAAPMGMHVACSCALAATKSSSAGQRKRPAPTFETARTID